jgi:hypothetical protein
VQQLIARNLQDGRVLPGQRVERHGTLTEHWNVANDAALADQSNQLSPPERSADGQAHLAAANDMDSVDLLPGGHQQRALGLVADPDGSLELVDVGGAQRRQVGAGHCPRDPQRMPAHCRGGRFRGAGHGTSWHHRDVEYRPSPPRTASLGVPGRSRACGSALWAAVSSPSWRGGCLARLPPRQ